MNYDQVVTHMKSLRTFPLWRYGAPWMRLRYDDKTGNIGLVGRTWPDKIWREVSDATMLITPDNKIRFTGDMSSVVLGTLGISGRLRTLNSRVCRRAYQHDCMYDYLMFPGLEIDFTSGKPLNSILVKNVKLNERLANEIDAKLNTLKTMYLGAARLKGTKLECNWSLTNETWAHDDIKRSMHFTRILEKLPTRWTDDMELILQEMINQNSHRRDEVIPLDVAFDKAVKFHRSDIYRYFGAIS